MWSGGAGRLHRWEEGSTKTRRVGGGFWMTAAATEGLRQGAGRNRLSVTQLTVWLVCEQRLARALTGDVLSTFFNFSNWNAELF